MEEFIIQSALGKFIIIEPYEKSSVLKADEISTIFKVLSVGHLADFTGHQNDLIIIEPQTVEKCMMGSQEVLYVRDTNIVARVGIKESTE